MRRKPTRRMECEKLNMGNDCFDCPKMKLYISRGDNYFNDNKAEIRELCTYCPKIFKADAIYRWIKYATGLNQKRNKGKKTTAVKKYGEGVKNLREEGKTLKEIAETLGIAYNTVRKIDKANKSL